MTFIINKCVRGLRLWRGNELAKHGKTLGAIIAAGEWRSLATLRYIDEDAVDTVQLAAALDDVSDSDDESQLWKDKRLGGVGLGWRRLVVC